ncbi:hypothetical protein LINGRAHAP2_LOCUS8165 [Linum grandiflorum]
MIYVAAGGATVEVARNIVAKDANPNSASVMAEEEEEEEEVAAALFSHQ